MASDNSDSDKTPSQGGNGRNKGDNGDVNNKDILDHLVTMAERLDHLEKSSEKMKRWCKKHKSRSKKNVTPKKLDFGTEEDAEDNTDYVPLRKRRKKSLR